MGFENKINYTFKKKKYLKNILTHPSYGISDFQAYEFLGDRVLGLIIAEICFKHQKNLKILSNEYNNIVKTESLSIIAEKWGILNYINHSIKNISKKNLADIVEVVIAAIYLDSDYNTTFLFVKNLYEKYLKNNLKTQDVKNLLQEYSQNLKLGLPVYTVVNEFVEDHVNRYTIEVFVENLGKGVGTGGSKRVASKIAAADLFEKIKEKK